MYLFFLFVFLFSLATLRAEGSWLIKEEFLSPASSDFDCHSSSLAEAADETLVVVWKGGKGKGFSNTTIKENVGIWFSRFEKGAWTVPQEIVTNKDSVAWTPVLYSLSDGELLLFHRMGENPRNAVSFLQRSRDGGLTWSKREHLPAGVIGPTKNKPLLASQGALLLPSSVEVGNPESSLKATACWIEITRDRGRTWKKAGPLVIPGRPFGALEPALVYDKEGNIRLFCRDRAQKIGEKGFIWTAVSKDQGMTFSELEKTPFPNPDSGIDAVNLKPGVILLAYNHSHTQRSPLNLALSLDGGKTWGAPFELAPNGEVPSMLLSSDGLLHITYAVSENDHEQRRIKHAVIDPEKLVQKDKSL